MSHFHIWPFLWFEKGANPSKEPPAVKQEPLSRDCKLEDMDVSTPNNFRCLSVFLNMTYYNIFTILMNSLFFMD
jgi:hypothetical protein